MAKADPKAIHSTFQSAKMAHQANNLREAEAGYRRVLWMNPGHPEALHHLGLIAAGASMYSDAIELFERAVALQPKNLAAQLDLARAHRELGHPQEAIKAFRRALKLAPTEAVVLAQLADLLHSNGEQEEALALVDQAMVQHPKVAQLFAVKSAILDALDRPQEAEAVCREAFKLAEEAGVQPPAMIVAGFARIAPKVGLEDEAVERLSAAIEQEQSRPVARVPLLFAMARIEEERANHGRAFELYAQANAEMPGQWNADTHSASIDSLISVYSPDRVRAMRRSRQTSDSPVFIVGMPGSGTALVQEALSAHPEIGSFGQPIDVWDMARRLSRDSRTQYMTPQFMDTVTTTMLDAAANRYTARCRSHARSAGRVTDALPTNFFNLGLIAQALPGARVIHCVREPLDACWSAFTAGNQPFARNLDDLGRYAHDQRRLTEHFKGVLDLPMHEISYEELVSDPAARTREAIEFLGLDPDGLDAGALSESFEKLLPNQRPGRSTPYRSQLADLHSTLDAVSNPN